MDERHKRDSVRQQFRRQTLTAAAAATLIPGRSRRADALKVTRLLYNSDPVIRIGAIENLTRIGGPDVIAHITQALNDRDPRVRTEACRALGNLRALTAKNKLYDALTDRSADVRCAAAVALADMGDKYGLPIVARLVCTAGAHQINALRALRHITRQKFSLTRRGLKEAIRWLKLRQKYLMQF